MRRGETLNLVSNSDNKKWELQNSSGETSTLPGACFMIPPPDAEALEKVNRYRVQTPVITAEPVMDSNETLCVCVCAVWTER